MCTDLLQVNEAYEFISVEKNSESLGCHLLDFSVSCIGDTQKW